jgi:hypothetical protein
MKEQSRIEHIMKRGLDSLVVSGWEWVDNTKQAQYFFDGGEARQLEIWCCGQHCKGLND